ncbi:TraH family protein [Rhizobium sp. AAP43]|uniref:TraH family protein n=1 Tax=Rhizobium sp. AAP43 TaxID=1523420 RepID=UPI0006B8BA30|nr:TraH family protein [Rhizobium sp. AAP43]KPF42610.1 conjugal transfer protein TraH [Rhizobium sp. AAP43]
MDLAFIQSCSDPALKPAIIQRFLDEVGSPKPLAVTVNMSGKAVLLPEPRSVDEAMATIQHYAGQAIVRVGVTQMPAGIGVKEIGDLDPALLDPCENLRIGTGLFAKIIRIVTKWYGNPQGEEGLPQVFDDAVYAWRTGEFEGVSVFQAQDPVPVNEVPMKEKNLDMLEGSGAAPQEVTSDTEPVSSEDAGMRINLSRLGGNVQEQ